MELLPNLAFSLLYRIAGKGSIVLVYRLLSYTEVQGNRMFTGLFTHCPIKRSPLEQGDAIPAHLFGLI
jgi:hypothetical protein